MERALADYLRHLGIERNASAYTVKSYREDLTQAVTFFRERLGSTDAGPDRITTRVLRAYLAWLHDQGYSKRTIARRIASVRSWLRFLCRRGVLQSNSAEGLRGPKQEKNLPNFLTAGDIQRLFAVATADDALGIRDKAMLETLYSAGLRVGELCGLKVDDLDLDEGVMIVRGKGRKERLALLGAAARKALGDWLSARDELQAHLRKTGQAVFLNKNEDRSRCRSVGRILEKRLLQAGLDS